MDHEVLVGTMDTMNMRSPYLRRLGLCTFASLRFNLCVHLRPREGLTGDALASKVRGPLARVVEW